MNRLLILCAFLLAYWPGAAAAADQTLHLNKRPMVLPNAADFVSGGELRMAKADALIRAVIPSSNPADPERFYVIHVLDWAEEPGKIKSSNWYVHRSRGSAATAAGRWTVERFKGSRIFGSDQVGLLYVHTNVPVESAAVVRAQVGAETNLTTVGSNHGALAVLGDYVAAKAYVGVSYQIDVVKKIPAPVQNLSDALGLLQSAALADAVRASLKPGAIAAGDEFDILHVPSDLTITGKLTTGSSLASTTSDLGSQTYDNEGLYHWDVSLGIPIRGMKELNFGAPDNTVFVNEVNKQTLLALVNVFVRPVDTKSARSVAIGPVVGMALSKSPADKLFVGLSVGLSRVQVFGGRLWNRVEAAATADPATEAQLAAEAERRYDKQWIIGINVPVRQVVDFLKGKK